MGNTIKSKAQIDSVKQHINANGEVKQKDIGVKTKEYQFNAPPQSLPTANVTPSAPTAPTVHNTATVPFNSNPDNFKSKLPNSSVPSVDVSSRPAPSYSQSRSYSDMHSPSVSSEVPKNTLKTKQADNSLKQHINAQGELKQKDVDFKTKEYQFNTPSQSSPTVNITPTASSVSTAQKTVNAPFNSNPDNFKNKLPNSSVPSVDVSSRPAPSYSRSKSYSDVNSSSVSSEVSKNALKTKQVNNSLKQHINAQGELKQKDVDLKTKDSKFISENSTSSVSIAKQPDVSKLKGKTLESDASSEIAISKKPLATRNTGSVIKSKGNANGFDYEVFDAPPLHTSSGASVIDAKNGKATRFKGKPKFAKNIKVRNAVLGTVRLTKNITSKTKEKIDEKTSPEQADTPEQFATDKMADYVLDKAKSGAKTAKDVAEVTAKEAVKMIKQRKPLQMSRNAADVVKDVTQAEKETLNKGLQSAKQTVTTAERFIKQRKLELPKQKIPNSSIKKVTSNRSVKAIGSAEKSIKKTRSGASKAGKSLKTVSGTIKNSVNSAKVAAEAAKKSAEAAKMTKEIAVKTAKATTKAVKVSAKAVVEAVKAVVAGVEELGALIVAAGVPTVVIVLVICIIGGLGATVFGIFLSNEKNEESVMTMSEAISMLDEEYSNKVFNPNGSYYEIKTNGDTLIDWKEVLAVYSVKTTTDDFNPLDVYTVTDEKIELLRKVIDEMYTIKTVEYTTFVMEQGEPTVVNGQTVPTFKSVPKKCLSVTVVKKTAAQYSQEKFSPDRQALLQELTSSEYDELWSSLLYGGGSGSGRVFPTTGDWAFPVPNRAAYISSPYGWRTVNGRTSLHEGIDIAAARGSIIIATKPGKVVTAVRGKGNDKSKPNYGNYVKIRHDDGTYSLYAHCNTVKVNVGQTVQKGQEIATVGDSGYAFGCHVHFEIRDRNDRKLNPGNYVKK